MRQPTGGHVGVLHAAIAATPGLRALENLSTIKRKVSSSIASVIYYFCEQKLFVTGVHKNSRCAMGIDIFISVCNQIKKFSTSILLSHVIFNDTAFGKEKISDVVVMQNHKVLAATESPKSSSNKLQRGERINTIPFVTKFHH